MSNDDPIQGKPEGAFSNLRRRIYLTYTYFGLRTILWRLVTFPLRFTPLQRRLRLRTHARDQERRRAAGWYREHGRPVDIVVPSYRDAERVRALVRSIRKTAPRGMTRVIVTDDASGPEHIAALRRIAGIDVLVESERNDGVRRKRQPRPARHRSRPRRGRAELRRRGPARLAGMPAVRGLPRLRRRHRRRAAAVSRRAHPVRRDRPQSRRARVVRPPLPLQARRLGSRRADQPRARRDRRVHVRAPRAHRAHRRARRALPDGLRGRRLLPARVAGGVQRALFPDRPARPPRVGHARHRCRRARA